MTTTIEVKHNFETMHRLPFLQGNCQNIHGHSWLATFTLYNYDNDDGVDANGISCEYGQVKSIIRSWIDKYLDHGAMLGAKDPLLPALLGDQYHHRTFVFGDFHDTEKDPEELTEDMRYTFLPWPTVEAVSQMLCDKLQPRLKAYHKRLWVEKVHVAETGVNAAKWIQPIDYSQDEA